MRSDLVRISFWLPGSYKHPHLAFRCAYITVCMLLENNSKQQYASLLNSKLFLIAHYLTSTLLFWWTCCCNGKCIFWSGADVHWHLRSYPVSVLQCVSHKHDSGTRSSVGFMDPKCRHMANALCIWNALFTCILDHFTWRKKY